MKAGDIVKIDDILNEITQYIGCKHDGIVCKDICKFSDKCPVLYERNLCCKNAKLTYGRWYSCSQVMPEDFGLIRVLLVLKLKGHYELRCRWNEDGKYFWTSYPDNEVTHWLAIPPLDKEE